MTNAKSTSSSIVCPCGSKNKYSQCCEPLHDGASAVDAEALMRSRYSAFALNIPEYIQRSWHHSTITQDFLKQNINETGMQWIGLQIKQHKMVNTTNAIVEFVARYKIAGKAYRLHERSRFILDNDNWYYLDGEQIGKS